MGENTAPQRPRLTPNETRLFSVSFAGQLDSGELLTGTPLVTEETTSNLTITNKALNTAVLTVNDVEVAIGQAVQFLVTGQLVATGAYKIRVKCGTDATPAQTIEGFVDFDVEDG